MYKSTWNIQSNFLSWKRITVQFSRVNRILEWYHTVGQCSWLIPVKREYIHSGVKLIGCPDNLCQHLLFEFCSAFTCRSLSEIQNLFFFSFSKEHFFYQLCYKSSVFGFSWLTSFTLLATLRWDDKAIYHIPLSDLQKLDGDEVKRFLISFPPVPLTSSYLHPYMQSTAPSKMSVGPASLY